MNRRIKCQNEGCPNEVLFKTLDGGFDNRRAGGGSDASTRSRRTTQSAPSYLAPNFDPLSDAAPRYARYEVCSDHQCNTRGCRTFVEGEFPHCAIHIKCQMSGCGEARHFSTKAKDYLAYCTNHSTCSSRRCTAIRMEGSPFCEEHTCHTCRSQKCHAYVDRLALFCSSHGCAKPKCHQEVLAERLCIDHFKEHYIVQGKRQAYGTRHRNIRHGHDPKREDEQLDDGLNSIPQDTAGDSSEEETLKSRPRGGSSLSALSQALRQNPPSYRGPSPASYTKQIPTVEYASSAAAAAVSGGDSARGGGNAERPELFVKIPEAASNDSGPTSMGRPIQGRRVEVEERNEDSEGWCGDT
ncbi:hypothetical protein C8A03DRAFT_45337 [Achaetomium macrosporum]|uniref:Uncharacterized protein n=1 Tax=Achaetomium macrosporum TaxID=79813 RepID=A0AAN7HE28_9PEZI|nr:hypothetical protein C8A03DRAFT_45337 [Achaetomium macrosporum]